MIKPEGIQQRGMEVMHMHRVFDGMKSEIIRRSISQTTFNTSARHPHRECRRMMIAAVAIFDRWRSPKFRAPDNQRVFQHSSLLQIGQQSCDGLVDLRTFFNQAFVIPGVMIPRIIR